MWSTTYETKYIISDKNANAHIFYASKIESVHFEKGNVIAIVGKSGNKTLIGMKNKEDVEEVKNMLTKEHEYGRHI